MCSCIRDVGRMRWQWLSMEEYLSTESTLTLQNALREQASNSGCTVNSWPEDILEDSRHPRRQFWTWHFAMKSPKRNKIWQKKTYRNYLWRHSSAKFWVVWPAACRSNLLRCSSSSAKWHNYESISALSSTPAKKKKNSKLQQRSIAYHSIPNS